MREYEHLQRELCKGWNTWNTWGGLLGLMALIEAGHYGPPTEEKATV